MNSKAEPVVNMIIKMITIYLVMVFTVVFVLVRYSDGCERRFLARRVRERAEASERPVIAFDDIIWMSPISEGILVQAVGCNG
jgi:hypothetical protein